MTVSHPNVVITFKMSVVKLCGGSMQPTEPAGEADGSSRGASGSTGSGGGLGSGSGKLVPALGGGSGMVEVVSPNDILQPG